MDEKLIKDAQYRKGLSIAFFNATNAAIQLVAPHYEPGKIKEAMDLIATVRDSFLEEHKTYYTNVIAQIGTTFSPQETIAKLKSATNLSALGSIWRSISADERAHPDVVKAKDELKATYEKAQ